MNNQQFLVLFRHDGKYNHVEYKVCKGIYGIFIKWSKCWKYFVLLTLPNLVYFCVIHNNGNNRLIHSEWLKSGYMYLLLRIRSKIS